MVVLMVDVTLLHSMYRQFYDLLEIFKIGGYCPDTNYLFLGTLRPLRFFAFFFFSSSFVQNDCGREEVASTRTPFH